MPGAGMQGSGAATFAGNGYIRVVFPNNARGQGTGVAIPLGNITFAMWFKTSAPALGGLQVVEGSTWGGGCDRVIGNGGGNVFNYNTWDEVNMSGAIAINDGAWHHMAYVLDRRLPARSIAVRELRSWRPPEAARAGRFRYLRSTASALAGSS